MPSIHPFRGVHYNQRLISDLADVTCPPYDIISPELQRSLYGKSTHNFVRLEFGQAFPNDGSSDSRYSRAAATLEQWLKEGVLLADAEPALYLHEHHFIYKETERVRRGIIARVRLEDETGSKIRPHEGTLAEPKTDRLNLLWALQANTSPVLALFEDTGQAIVSLLARSKPASPLLRSREASAERHEVWAITDPMVTGEASRLFSERALYIADGHHRYESALTYRRQRLSCTPSLSADEPFNFVMMSLVDFADPGLIILPPHRLVRGLSRSALHGFIEGLSAFFDINEFTLDAPDIRERLDSSNAGGEVQVVLFGLKPDRLFLLTLRDMASASQMMPCFHGELYRRLEVSVVDHVILGELLGLDNDQTEAVGYCYDHADAINRVLNGEYQLAFLLKPLTTGVIKAVADAGERMPKKSTYFYPKAPAGLVFYRL